MVDLRGVPLPVSTLRTVDSLVNRRTYTLAHSLGFGAHFTLRKISSRSCLPQYVSQTRFRIASAEPELATMVAGLSRCGGKLDELERAATFRGGSSCLVVEKGEALYAKMAMGRI